MRPVAHVMMLALVLWVRLSAVQPWGAYGEIRPQPRTAADLAPEFPAGIQWLDTDHPLTMRELRGKVVLLDFWACSCINCLHSIPAVQWLEAEYPQELVGSTSTSVWPYRDHVGLSALPKLQLTRNLRSTRIRLIFHNCPLNASSDIFCD